ncbi:WXG100 family type VII secretion target [Rhodococcus fascians]|nr:WXG100 family type VII secretion target [Rhodococcus fascians]MBY4237294.1 WXG100 family type VII secretion target [Rhodococcus fascians]MBY4252973.1 WXG100 family type VII secretion target [Rhodococcus fascians]MBY4268787.1 WXG100 family type VII secretion target [Rhodococcus fascians]
MTKELLSAKTPEIAGLGNLLDRIGVDTLASHHYLLDNAGLGENVPGEILKKLRPYIARFQEMTRTRHVHLSANCGEMGAELNKAAWLYADQDRKNYDLLNAHTSVPPLPGSDRGSSDHAAAGHADEFDGAADYGRPHGIDYPPTNPAIDDIRDVLADASEWLGEIDRTIFELSGWSPLREATIPVTGNWNEIRRIGQAYQTAGDAMEAAAESLAAGVRRVDGHWNGAAAQAFTDYADRQLAAMRWEGHAGRTIAAICTAIAEQLRGAALAVVRKIVELLESEVALDNARGALKVVLKKVPVVGTACQVESIIEICLTAMDLTKDLIVKIEQVVDDFGGFLDALGDPEGQVGQKIDDTLRPLNDLLDYGKQAVEAGKTADIRPVLDTPDEDFSVGTGDEPWRDA